MSSAPRYHFASRAQWASGLLRGAAFIAPESAAWMPLAPLQPVDSWPGLTCVALAVAREGAARWNDGQQTSAYLEPDDAATRTVPAPLAFTRARHLVAGRSQWWSSDGKSCLHAWTRHGPVLRFSVDLPLAQVHAICSDGRDGIWVLGQPAAGDGAHAAGNPALTGVASITVGAVLHVDAYGQVQRHRGQADADSPGGTGDHADARTHTDVARAPSATAEAPGGRGLAVLHGAARDELVLLTADGRHLVWLDARGGRVLRELALNLVASGLCAQRLASDGRDRLFLAGVTASKEQADPPLGDCTLLVLDAQGEPLDRISEPGRVTNLACGGAWLLLATTLALHRYRLSRDGAEAVRSCRASFVSPVLDSPPAGGPHPWLRADLRAWLPAGCQASLSWIATDSGQEAAQWRAILADDTRPPLLRLAALGARHGLAWSEPLHLIGGEVATAQVDDAGAPGLHALPLHEVHQRYLCLTLELHSAPGSARPVVHALDVVYPDVSLMQYLPGVYRRQAEEPGDLMRRVVGVLDASVDQFDQRIGALGQLLDPRATDPAWLDALAGWLGLPWDVNLPEDRKRALLARSGDLLTWRGTRHGLELLLTCLLPPGRVLRLFDPTAADALARLPCAGETGPALPALLGGLLPRALVLGRKALLGVGCLPQRPQASDINGTESPALELCGYLELQIRASTTERRAWAPWLEPVLQEMVPLNARLRLIWREESSLTALPVLDGELRLGSPTAPARLGDSTLGLARLPRSNGPTLDASGPTPGISL